MRLAAALTGFFVTIGCGSALPQPTALDASRGSAQFADLTLQELQQGRTLYVSRCGGCHALKRPTDIAPEHWQEQVAAMRSKNGVKLSDDEAQAIVRYLVVSATSPSAGQSARSRQAAPTPASATPG